MKLRKAIKVIQILNRSLLISVSIYFTNIENYSFQTFVRLSIWYNFFKFFKFLKFNFNNLWQLQFKPLNLILSSWFWESNLAQWLNYRLEFLQRFTCLKNALEVQHSHQRTIWKLLPLQWNFCDFCVIFRHLLNFHRR